MQLPAPLLFYRNKIAASIFLFFALTMSVVNGASFYVEVWGRRFERELIALRKEIEVARAAEQRASNALDEGPDSGTSAAQSRRNSADLSGLEDDFSTSKKDQ
jgi:hypothetical protein